MGQVFWGIVGYYFGDFFRSLLIPLEIGGKTALMMLSGGFWFPLFSLVAVQIMGTRNLLVEMPY
jgi:hypothetical protein